MWGEDDVFSVSRSILNIGVERQLQDGWVLDAKLEWDQFLNNPTSGSDNFRNRLGYFTLNHDDMGSLRFGKQWSAYHDVARYMDNLVIIDPDATPIYSEGTDGGFAATGRGDNLAYASHVDFDVEGDVTGDRQVSAIGLSYASTPKTILSFEAKHNKLNEFSGQSSRTDNGGGFNFAYVF
ncbi:hypothetical protein ACFL53_03440 [Pseudomonadota bacterium]